MGKNRCLIWLERGEKEEGLITPLLDALQLKGEKFQGIELLFTSISFEESLDFIQVRLTMYGSV